MTTFLKTIKLASGFVFNLAFPVVVVSQVNHHISPNAFAKFLIFVFFTGFRKFVTFHQTQHDPDSITIWFVVHTDCGYFEYIKLSQLLQTLLYIYFIKLHKRSFSRLFDFRKYVNSLIKNRILSVINILVLF